MSARALLALGALAVLTGRPLRAQDPASYLASGIRAYQDLDFDAAAGFLRRATEAGLPSEDRQRGLAYLGAAEIFRGRSDSAQAAFGRLVRENPRYHIDGLVFPPEVTSVFDGVRRGTRVVAVAYPDSARFAVGDDGLALDLFASAFHEIRVEIQRPDGSGVRTVYAGSIADSLRVTWDGANTAGEPLAGGRYLLAIASLDLAGSTVRLLRLPMAVELLLPDTAFPPAPPADSLMLPERAESAPALEALIGGIAAGLAVAVVPKIVAPDTRLSPARLGIGLSIGIAGISAFVAQRPGRPIAENVRANEALRATWRNQVEQVSQRNASLRRMASVRVRLGAPQVIERDAP